MSNAIKNPLTTNAAIQSNQLYHWCTAWDGSSAATSAAPPAAAAAAGFGTCKTPGTAQRCGASYATMGLGIKIALFTTVQGETIFAHVQRTYGNKCVTYRVTGLANCTNTFNKCHVKNYNPLHAEMATSLAMRAAHPVSHMRRFPLQVRR